MTLFWIGATVLVLGMIALILAPMRYLLQASPTPDARRAQNVAAYRVQLEELERSGLEADALANARTELGRMLLEDTADQQHNHGSAGGRALLIAAALSLPLIAFPLYWHLGAASTLLLEEQLEELRAADSEQASIAKMLEIMPALEAAAARDESGEYQFLRARFLMMLEQYPEAAAAYAALAVEFPGDGVIAAQYAQALYMAAGNRMTPEVRAQVERANQLDPSQVTLLGMLGMDQFQNGQYAEAIRSWERLLVQLDPNSADAGIIRDGIAMARKQLTDAGEAVPTSSTVVDDAPIITVSVSLDEAIVADPSATVFVFARAESGPPMPLAVQRFPVQELPKAVTLSDAQAMMPEMRLSRFPRVVVVARVSNSGQPTAQPGDFEGGGEALDIRAGEQRLNIVIDRAL